MAVEIMVAGVFIASTTEMGSSRAGASTLVIANAHAALERPYRLSAPMPNSIALANTANRSMCGQLSVANAHAMLARICAFTSTRHRCATLANDTNSSASG